LWESEFVILLAYLLAFVTGGYGIGTWLGKTLGSVLGRDMRFWGDLGGIWGGLAGFGVFIGVAIARVTT
jgi:hypothetical protein